MIVLFNPRSSASGKPILPMSILSMAAMLEGWLDYQIIDGNLCDDPTEQLQTAIREYGANILAITVMPGRQVRQARDVSRALKAEFPQLNVVWGGYFPTMYPNAAVNVPYVDFVLRGHAEEAFVALIRTLRNDKRWRNQAGLTWTDCETGAIMSNPIGPVPDLNALPDYPYHRIDMETYILSTFLGSRTLSHHASYGCPFTCNFCGVVNMVNGRYSAQSPEMIDHSVDKLVRTYGANALQFYDNNFFVSESRSAEICKRLIPYGIAWWTYGRVDTLMKYSDRTWSLMRDSGLRMVYIGAEAGSDETLERMNKGGKQTSNLTLEIAKRMKSYGIIPEMSFVIGCPPDPDGDIDRTFRFIRCIKQINEDTEIILYPYAPVPVEGQLLHEAKAFGFAFPETLDEWAEQKWIDFSERTNTALPWLSAATQQKIGNFQRVLHAAFPTCTDPKLIGARRAVLRMAGLWRYKLQWYRSPFELMMLNRLLPHKRPEVTGF